MEIIRYHILLFLLFLSACQAIKVQKPEDTTDKAEDSINQESFIYHCSEGEIEIPKNLGPLVWTADSSNMVFAKFSTDSLKEK